MAYDERQQFGALSVVGADSETLFEQRQSILDHRHQVELDFLARVEGDALLNDRHDL